MKQNPSSIRDKKYYLNHFIPNILSQCFYEEKLLSDVYLNMSLSLLENGLLVDENLFEDVLEFVDKESMKLNDNNFNILMKHLIVRFDFHSNKKYTLLTRFKKTSHFEWFLNHCKKLNVLNNEIYIYIFQNFLLYNNNIHFNKYITFLDDDLYLKCISSLSNKTFLNLFKKQLNPDFYYFRTYLTFILSISFEIFKPIFLTPLTNGQTILTWITRWRRNDFLGKEVKEKVNIRAKEILLLNDFWFLESLKFEFYWQWIPMELVQDQRDFFVK